MSKNKKHILIISQYFYPEQFRINDIAQEWVKRGYKVTVLTGIPNYPLGKFYDGYSLKNKRQEKWNGIDIIRVPLIPRGKTPVGMILNYCSFAFFGKRWAKKTKLKADLVFSYEVSPMTQVKVGCKYSSKNKISHYLYVQDLWPENVIEVTGIKTKLVIKPIDKMVDKIYSQSDKIFVTSPSFVEAIVNRKKKVDKEKVHYWPQYAEEFYRPLKKQKVDGIPDDSSIKIAFTGNIGTAQGLDILPKTAKLLGDKDIKFIIVGDGRNKAQFIKNIEKLGVQEKFILIPKVDATEIPKILSACDAGFISFNKSELWAKTIPAKLQSYMACGKAIIASATGETKRIIQDADCGICAEIGNEKDLFKKIQKIDKELLRKWGENSRQYFENNFDKKRLMDYMDKEIEKVRS